MSTIVEIRAPEQSEGTRLQVQRWLKAVGESIDVDEPLIEVETDKVTVEIASPARGVLRRILKREQEEIEPGELLGSIETGPAMAPAAGTRLKGSTMAALSAYAAATVAAGRISPAVRRLLDENGLHASAVRGTGGGGRVTVDDVLAHAACMPQAAAMQPPSGVRRVPHSLMRKCIAERMVGSLLHTAPHVTTVFEVDMAAVLAHRARHRIDFEARGASLTLTTYFLAACVAAIREVPEVNSRWTADALEVFERLDIGVATVIENQGLVAPVVRNVSDLDLFGIARALGTLVAKARAHQLGAADLEGGTFTISNHGVSGSVVATPIIINQPQSAILGVGKLEKRAVVVTADGEDRIVIRPRCYVTLTIDHRVLDGHRANRFLEVWVRWLENCEA